MDSALFLMTAMKVVRFHHLIVFTWQNGSNFNRELWIWLTFGKWITWRANNSWWNIKFPCKHASQWWILTCCYENIFIYEDRTQSRWSLIKLNREVSSVVSKIPWSSGRPRKKKPANFHWQVLDNRAWRSHLNYFFRSSLTLIIRLITTISVCVSWVSLRRNWRWYRQEHPFPTVGSSSPQYSSRGVHCHTDFAPTCCCPGHVSILKGIIS